MELHFRRFDLQLIHNWMVASSLSYGGKTLSPVALVELRDRDSVVGYGEAAPSMRYQENVETCLQFLKKVDASRLSFDDMDASMRYVESLSPHDHSAKGAVNIALLDGAAKKAGLALHDFLGLSSALCAS